MLNGVDNCVEFGPWDSLELPWERAISCKLKLVVGAEGGPGPGATTEVRTVG